VPHDRGHLGRRLAHQRPVGLRLRTLELLRERADRDADLLLFLLPAVGPIDRGAHAADHLAHQVHHRGEEHLPLVLNPSLTRKDPVDLLGREHMLDQRRDHHRHRTFRKNRENTSLQTIVLLHLPLRTRYHDQVGV
jgi:hypothetical protein